MILKKTQEPTKSDAMQTLRKIKSFEKKMGRKVVKYNIKKQTTYQGLPYLLEVYIK